MPLKDPKRVRQSFASPTITIRRLPPLIFQKDAEIAIELSVLGFL